MGLDVMVKEYLEIPDTVKTEDELSKFCDEHGGSWTIYSDDHKNLPKKYVKKIPLRLCDWEATFKKRGLDFNDYEETCAEIGRWYDFRKKSAKRTGNEELAINLHRILGDGTQSDDDTTVRINNDEIVEKIEPVAVWAYGREVGYQRKGANNRFYRDGKWDSNTIVSTKKMLLEDWKKYFSSKRDPMYGANARQEFKKNIIDNFVPGKTFVCYW